MLRTSRTTPYITTFGTEPPRRDIFGGYGPGPAPDTGNESDNRNEAEKAAFSEIYWQFLPRFTLTGGAPAIPPLRSLDRHHREIVRSTALQTFRSHLQHQDSVPVPISSYKINDDAHLYAGWSQGSRLGQPQIELPPNLCDPKGTGFVEESDISIASTRQVSSDTMSNYEFGGKFALLDHRLTIDADVFHMIWDDVPVTVSPGTGLCNSGYTANAGKAKSDGVEFQTNYQLTGAFRVTLGGSWINARI